MKKGELLHVSEKTSAGTREGSAHSGVGRFLQCPLRLSHEELPEAGSFLSSCGLTLLHLKITRRVVVIGPGSQ